MKDFDIGDLVTLKDKEGFFEVTGIVSDDKMVYVTPFSSTSLRDEFGVKFDMIERHWIKVLSFDSNGG